MRVITLTAISGVADMYDAFLETQTETAEQISVSFPIAGFNAVAILNNYGVSASLTVDGVTQTVSLIRDSIKDWWDYWFAPSRRGRDTVFYFPLQTSGNATLVISQPGGTAKCGLCITGLAREIARTKYGLSVGITDYSRISENLSHQTYHVPGNWAKRADVPLNIYNTDIDVAYREIVKNRATPCIFDYNTYAQTLSERHTSEDKYQALVIYGYTEDFSISVPGPVMSTAKHESQGLA